MGIRPRAARASGALASPSAARANTARFGTGLRLPRPRGLGVTSARECATLGSKDAGSSPFSFCLPSLGLTPDFCPGAALRRLPNQWRCGYAAARWWARGPLLHEGPSRAPGAHCGLGWPLVARPPSARAAPTRGRPPVSSTCKGFDLFTHVCRSVYFRCVSVCSGPHTPVAPSHSLSFLGHLCGPLS